MNKQKLEAGSAHLIIVIVLVVALLGSLGFIFWQNFVQTKTITNHRTSVVLDNSVTDLARGTGLSFNYPSSWSYDHYLSTIPSTYPSGTYDKGDWYSVTSPDSKISVILRIGMYGGGGTGPSKKAEIIEKDSVPSMTNSSFVAYFCTGDDTEGASNNEYGIQVVEKDKLQTLENGYCPNVYVYNHATKGDKIFDEYSSYYLDVTLKDIDENNYTSNMTINTVKENIQTEDFAVAKQIAQSLYIK